MSICYYCELNPAIGLKYEKPACQECSDAEIHAVTLPKSDQSNEKLAMRLKIIMNTFRDAFSEEG